MEKYSVDTVALKKRMLECGVGSIKDLSVNSGINRNTLGGILSGKTVPSADSMYKLVSALKIGAAEAGTIFFNRDLRNK